MHGGLKVYRGSAAAARNYVEADRSRADDYYLAEGSGLAQRLVARPGDLQRRADLDGATYEQWVAGYDVGLDGLDQRMAPKGRLRKDDHAVRFLEVTVNGPKTWSVAAALHPEIAQAYDAAQDHAAAEIIGWVAEHATTRVGPRGRQVQVPVEEIEAAVVRHFTSRAGDPHRHLHLQINARVRAAGGWRGLHTVGVRDSLEAINGIGHAAVMTDPGFRAALAAHGYSLDDTSGWSPSWRRTPERSARGRGRSRPTSTGTRPSGVVSILVRSPVRRCARRGTAGRGPMPAPTILRNHVFPTLGEMRIDAVTRADAQSLVKEWLLSAAPSTTQGRYLVMAIMFRAAVKDRVLPTTPCLDIKLPKIPPKSSLVPISTETVFALRETISPRYRLFVTLAAGTGMRRGEILGLTLDRIAFDFATIRVDRQLSRAARTGKPVFGPPKTPSSTRTIPVGDVVLQAIKRHAGEYGTHESGLLFTTDLGNFVGTSTIHNAWRIAAKKVPTDATPHDLRHYFASVQIRGGQSIKVLQALLGHKSAVETWDTYGHLMGDEDTRSRAIVDELLRTDQTPQSATRADQ